MSETTVGRLKLLALVAVFAIPLGIASLIYLNPQKDTSATTNRGNLVEPVRVIGDLRLADNGSERFAQKPFSRYWTMLFWSDADCDLYCEANLFKIRQAKKILGRHAARVKTVYLSAPDTALSDNTYELLRSHPTLQVLRLAQTDEAFVGLPGGRIYLVDPLGNLMMSYPRDVSTRDIAKDAKLLLKASKIG